MNGFGMKHGKTPSSRPTCFAIWRNVERLSAVRLRAVEAEVELDLAGRVLVVALDHVEPELLPVLDHLVDDRLELGELVDVVAVGLGHALDRGRAVRVQLEPHHLRLHAGPQMHARSVSSNSSWMRRRFPRQSEVSTLARVLAVLAVAEARAPDARDLRVPGQRPGTSPAPGSRRAPRLRGRSRCSCRGGRRRGSPSSRRRAGSPSAAIVSQCGAGTPLPMMRPVTETNW